MASCFIVQKYCYEMNLSMNIVKNEATGLAIMRLNID